MQPQASSTNSDTKWLMLWHLQGKPLTLPEDRIRQLPAAAFRYLKRGRFTCAIQPNVALIVQRLFESTETDHNYLVSLLIYRPERRRNRTKRTDAQCPEAALHKTINQLLDEELT